MLLYKDRFTDDEMFSDAFPAKLVDNVIYEVNCAMVTVKTGIDVDIGANPSAEEQDEALEEGEERVNQIVQTFRLQQTSFDKKTYMTYLRSYFKKLGEHLADGKAFQTAAADYVKKNISSKFDELQFYTGASESAIELEGMVVLLNYREDGMTPYLMFWKDGLLEQKL